MNQEQATQLFNQLFEQNYRSGVPRIPPHTHNGIDNLKIPASNITGLTSSQAFAIGGVYINITGVNPATELGYGTWTALGSGQVLVGFASGDPDFGTLLQTGGAKTVTLTTSQIPSHAHNFTGINPGLTKNNNGGGSAGTQEPTATTAPGATWFYNTDLAGGGTSHTNLSPYIVVAFWQRTA